MTGVATARIETERLILEPLVVEHAEEMVEVLGDPHLHTFIGGAPLSIEELRARFTRLTTGPPADRGENWLNWVVRWRDDEALVGTVQATVTTGPSPEAELAWVIGTPWQRQGIAAEAARALVALFEGKHMEVTANIHPDHAASAAVAAAAGLVATTQVIDGEVVWRRRHGKSGRTVSSSTA